MDRLFTVRIRVNEEDAANDAEYFRYGRNVAALLEGELLSHLHSLEYVEDVAVEPTPEGQ